MKHRRPLKARLGWAGYAHLLAHIARWPGTLPDLARNSRVGRDTIYRVVPDLHALGRLHISSWSMDGRTLPIYSLGPGVDIPPPLARPNGRPVATGVVRHSRLSPEIVAFCTMLRAIEVPCTLQEIVEVCGCDRDTAKSAIMPLMAADLAHIHSYTRRSAAGGAYMANYVLGEGENAVRPNRRMLQRQAGQRWRDNMRRKRAADPLLQAFGIQAPPTWRQRKSGDSTCSS